MAFWTPPYDNKGTELDITVTRNEEGNELVLHIANMSNEEQPLHLRLGDEKSLPEQITQINISGNEDDRNSPSEPHMIIPVEKKVNPRDMIWLEAKSYTVIRF